MYTTYNNRQIERYLESMKKDVDTSRCIQHITIDREEEEVGTDRFIQYATIDK